jgi:hypothetical protein
MPGLRLFAGIVFGSLLAGISLIGVHAEYGKEHPHIAGGEDAVIMSFTSCATPGYRPGMNIFGIIWDERYSETRFEFTNSVKEDVKDVDLHILMEAGAIEFAQITKVPIMLRPEVDGLPGPLIAKWKDSNGRPFAAYSTAPLDSQKILTNMFHFHCDRLVNGFPVKLIFAGFDSRGGSGLSRYARIEGQFSVGDHKYTIIKEFGAPPKRITPFLETVPIALSK